VELELVAFDRELQAGAVFIRRTLQFEQKRAVDEFDVDPAVLHGFNRIGYLDQLAGCGFRVSVGRSAANFMRLVFAVTGAWSLFRQRLAIAVAHDTLRSGVVVFVRRQSAGGVNRTAHDSFAWQEADRFLPFYRMMRAPFMELRNHRPQAHPQRGQAIVDPLRFLGEGLPIDQTMFFQRPQLLQQDLLRQPGNLVFKVAGAQGTVQQDEYDHGLPASGNDAQGPLDGEAGKPLGDLPHAHQLVCGTGFVQCPHRRFKKAPMSDASRRRRWQHYSNPIRLVMNWF
jgi:hypothetical protein